MYEKNIPQVEGCPTLNTDLKRFIFEAEKRLTGRSEEVSSASTSINSLAGPSNW
jgi:hypothetical protein